MLAFFKKSVPVFMAVAFPPDFDDPGMVQQPVNNC
jgi:hypothetical protein